MGLHSLLQGELYVSCHNFHKTCTAEFIHAHFTRVVFLFSWFPLTSCSHNRYPAAHFVGSAAVWTPFPTYTWPKYRYPRAAHSTHYVVTHARTQTASPSVITWNAKIITAHPIPSDSSGSSRQGLYDVNVKPHPRVYEECTADHTTSSHRHPLSSEFCSYMQNV